MYYVIKRQEGNPFVSFIGFSVRKYIANKKNDSVIFEFLKDGKNIRKWIKVQDIILLTDDLDFFNETMKKFQNVQTQQQKLVNEAQKNLNKTIEKFTESVTAEISDFQEIRNASDVPCLLKTL